MRVSKKCLIRNFLEMRGKMDHRKKLVILHSGSEASQGKQNLNLMKDQDMR